MVAIAKGKRKKNLIFLLLLLFSAGYVQYIIRAKSALHFRFNYQTCPSEYPLLIEWMNEAVIIEKPCKL